MSRARITRRIAAMNKLWLLSLLLLAGCLAKPDYQRPAIDLPAAWKETAPAAVLDGRWWTVYGDSTLDALVEESLKGNTNLAVAVARVDEARALVKDAEAALYPTVDATGVRRRTLSSAATGLLPPGIPRELN